MNRTRTCVNIFSSISGLFLLLRSGTKCVPPYPATYPHCRSGRGRGTNEEAANVGDAESGRERRHGQEQGAGRGAGADRARLRQGLDHEARPARGASRSKSISTGSLGLDIALGIGGLPQGRIVEIYGPESSGKTTLALHVIAEAQKDGGTCAFIDAEHALDPGYARKLGVNIDELLISQPDTGEQALEIADTLVRSGAIDVLVINSVAALVPRAELEGEMGDTLRPAGAPDEPGAAQAHRPRSPSPTPW